MTTRALILFLLLPMLCAGQTGAPVLVNQPAPFRLSTYPGNPLSILVSLGTDSLKTTAAAVLQYAAGQRAFPSESQPIIVPAATSFYLNWVHYPAVVGEQYLAVSLGGTVVATGYITSSYLSATTTAAQSATLTINRNGLTQINLRVVGAPGGGVSGTLYKTFTLTGVHAGDNLQHGLNTRLVDVKAYQSDTGQYDPLWSQFSITSDVAVQIRGPANEVCNCTFVITPYKTTSN